MKPSVQQMELAIAKHFDFRRNIVVPYWITLSTLWVSYSGFSDINLWRRLFGSKRPGRSTSLMKPNEVKALAALPEVIVAYRAHRIGETDWLSYTVSSDAAGRFAVCRGVDRVREYRIQKSDVLALFLRRDEFELLVLDPSRAEAGRWIDVVEAESFAEFRDHNIKSISEAFGIPRGAMI